MASTLAGLSTLLGGLAVFFVKPHDKGAISLGLGLAASAMLTVSIVDLFLGVAFMLGLFDASICVILGFLTFHMLSRAGPMFLKTMSENAPPGRRLWRLAVLNTITLTAHNFPEGCAVVVSTLQSEKLGLKMALALALHNIPEGLCIAVPAYASGEHSRTTALAMTLFSGMSEPLGALLSLLLLQPLLTPERVNYALSFVGGIMIYVSTTELIPEGLRQEQPLHFATGLIVGTFIMSVSLMMLS
eukprot:CAMPEP_0114543368 /NCGR_PEP_ID=MMETSP0114-20121206/2317_1 /TAXON_ID=31324 /ORGANISM="Goniomonas sp, Strain m" /LENGTH=243 /DNA_ID=CAMNT_0001727699 /DNA_START=75 /DNA_END=806 /DNA_ORIENTATION=-